LVFITTPGLYNVALALVLHAEYCLVPAFPFILLRIVCGLRLAVIHTRVLRAEVVCITAATSVREGLAATPAGVVVESGQGGAAWSRLTRHGTDTISDVQHIIESLGFALCEVRMQAGTDLTAGRVSLVPVHADLTALSTTRTVGGFFALAFRAPFRIHLLSVVALDATGWSAFTSRPWRGIALAEITPVSALHPPKLAVDTASLPPCTMFRFSSAPTHGASVSVSHHAVLAFYRAHWTACTSVHFWRGQTRAKVAALRVLEVAEFAVLPALSPPRAVRRLSWSWWWWRRSVAFTDFTVVLHLEAIFTVFEACFPWTSLQASSKLRRGPFRFTTTDITAVFIDLETFRTVHETACRAALWVPQTFAGLASVPVFHVTVGTAFLAARWRAHRLRSLSDASAHLTAIRISLEAVVADIEATLGAAGRWLVALTEIAAIGIFLHAVSTIHRTHSRGTLMRGISRWWRTW